MELIIGFLIAAHIAMTGVGAGTITAPMLILFLHVPVLLPPALIWINHIGVDRLLGYGLKYSDGFGWTHLGRLGKRNATLPSQP